MRSPNVTLDIYHGANAPPNAPDVQGATGHLSPNFRPGQQSNNDVNSRTFVWTDILEVPLDIDIRDTYPGAPDQKVFIPHTDTPGEGQEYLVVFVEKVTAFHTPRGKAYKRVYLHRELWSVADMGITIREVDGAPSYASINTLEVDQADGFVLTQPAANQARLDINMATLAAALASELSLDDLSDVVVPAPSPGDSLVFNGVTWENITLAYGLNDLDGVSVPTPADGQVLTYDNGTSNWVAADPAGASILNELDDVNIDTPANGDILTFNGTLWVNAPPTPGFTSEDAVDAVATALTAGAGISINYDDPGNTITVASTITQYTDEMAQDACATLIQNGTGITWAYNDGANTLTPTVTITQYTDEQARDAIGTALTAGAGISITVSDPGDTITVAGKHHGCFAYPSGGDQSIATSTWTSLNFAAELWDTDGYHSTSSNTSRITIPSGLAGKYLLMGNVTWNAFAGQIITRVMKNGTAHVGCYTGNTNVTAAGLTANVSCELDLAVGDYVELQVWQNSGSNRSTYTASGGSTFTWFSLSYLGS